MIDVKSYENIEDLPKILEFRSFLLVNELNLENKIINQKFLTALSISKNVQNLIKLDF